MILKVKVTPNAKKNEVIGWFGDRLKMKIAAPPEKGKANKELIKYLAKELSIPKSSVVIIRGGTSSSKILEIQGISLVDVENKLNTPQLQDLLI